MIFSNPEFWFFFGLLILVYQFIYQKNTARSGFLLLFSLFFYYRAGGFFFFLIIFSTIVDFFVGQAIYKSQSRPAKTFLLVISLVINLGLLSYFKYTYFFADLLNQAFDLAIEPYDYLSFWANQTLGTQLDYADIILPVGISFYTFQTLSYTIDLYRGKIQPVYNIWEFAFYVSFFPQLVAGPIVRAADFIPQIYQKYHLEAEDYGKALFLILNGLVKKILISDYISVNFVDRVFESPRSYSGFENLMAVYGYAIQIYCDFSGYTDIAIGLALLLGYRLNINFNSPYVAPDITDFWRRWHISLSTWLRDYLYIPLGGNRRASWFTFISVPLCFFILLLVENATWYQWYFFLGILFLWVLWQSFPRAAWFAYLDLGLIMLFVLEAARLGQWYLMATQLALLGAWVAVLIQPSLSRSVSTYLNLLITMLLGGLWHGASTRFIIWGAMHGLALALHKLWMDLLGNKGQESKGFSRFMGQFITFHFVCFCWIYFRASDIPTVHAVLEQIAFSFQAGLIPEIIGAYYPVFLLMVFGFMVHFLPVHFKKSIQTHFIHLPEPVKALFIVCLVLILYQARTADIQPFIYFQF